MLFIRVSLFYMVFVFLYKLLGIKKKGGRLGGGLECIADFDGVESFYGLRVLL